GNRRDNGKGQLKQKPCKDNGQHKGDGQLPGGGFGPGNGWVVPGPGGGAVLPGAAGSLHGEFTQGQPATTYLFQRGAVTVVSSTSMTVKSSDGFSATYAVSSSTQVRGANASQITDGTDVMVVANKKGSAAVRVRVIRSGAGPSLFGGGPTT
ncbi:MAG: hypothetical protein ABI131_06670, partial [Nostocoides sp.]